MVCAQAKDLSAQAHVKVGGGVKKAKSKKGPGAKRRAKDLVDQFGCARVTSYSGLLRWA